MAPRVPYPALRAAERNARREHPEATNIKAMWTPASEHEIAVEVWNGNGATVKPVIA